jgi:PAS domain S-box-containing protein
LILEDSGDFTVTTALSASDASRLLEQEKFDAIVSDYQMPEMNGIEFLVEVRTRFGLLPFILFTGRGREEVVIQAINRGADFYLQKGGEPEEEFVELSHKIKQAALRKMADDALKKTEEKYQYLIGHSDEAIVVAQDKWLKMVNHRAVELTGYSEQELLSMPFSVLIHPDDRAMVVERYQKRLKDEESPSRYTFRLSQKDGSTRWVESKVSVIDLDGGPATLDFLTDISERKKAEEALQNLTRELESRVSQRTAELEEEIVQRKAAEATIMSSLHEKEVLLREIHHRVKNNLQIITSLIRLQKEQITDVGTIHALQDSESRIRSMALVHERLYRSPDLTSIDFSDYIHALATNLISTYATDPKQIRLNIDVKDISLDINRAIPVGLIMNELIANAFKHAFPNGRSGEITITGRHTSAGITLSVQDNGVGLPDGLDWRNTQTLGLRLVLTLIRQVKGSIELNRTGGTVFEMIVPLAREETT